MTDEIEKELSHNVGCSDIGAIMGVDQYRTAADVFDRLTGYKQEKNPQMERGHVMEPVIAAKYQEATGRVVEPYPVMLKDRELPFLVGHMDRVFLEHKDKGVLEIKAPGSNMLRKIKREGIPGSHYLQLQGYLMLSGYVNGAWCSINYDDWHLIHFDVEPDSEAFLMIRSGIKNFWDKHIMTNRRPELYQEPKVLDLPEIGKDEKIVRMEDPDWFEAVADLKEAKELTADAEMIEKQAKTKIQAIMEKYGASVAEGAGSRIYWKEQEGRKRFDHQAFGKAHPDLTFEMMKYFKRGKPSKPFRVFWT